MKAWNLLDYKATVSCSRKGLFKGINWLFFKIKTFGEPLLERIER
jgi:hypothetical protein